MLSDEMLRAWAQREASTWFEDRWNPQRRPLAELIAAAYVQGGTDALKEETERILEETKRLGDWGKEATRAKT